MCLLWHHLQYWADLAVLHRSVMVVAAIADADLPPVHPAAAAAAIAVMAGASIIRLARSAPSGAVTGILARVSARSVAAVPRRASIALESIPGSGARASHTKRKDRGTAVCGVHAEAAAAGLYLLAAILAHLRLRATAKLSLQLYDVTAVIVMSSNIAHPVMGEGTLLQGLTSTAIL
jgi:hypothetical protein